MTDLEKLAKERWIFASWLTAGMVVSYFGFILLIAFNKEFVGSLIVPGLSWGIVLGVAVIFSAWILTFVYTRWANGPYDSRIAAHKAKQGRGAKS